MFLFYREVVSKLGCEKLNEARMVVHVFNPSTWGVGGQKQEDFCEFKVSLVFRVSPRTARVV